MFDLQNWEQIQTSCPVSIPGKVQDWIPQKYTVGVPFEVLGRSEPCTFPKKYWEIINDPNLETSYQKEMLVERYFAVMLYVVGVSPECIKTIPKNAKLHQEDFSETTSFLKQTHTQTTEFRSLIKSEAGVSVGSLKAGLSSEIESKFGSVNVFEQSRTTIHSSKKVLDFPVVDYDQLYVPWVLSHVFLVFRESKEKNVKLISATEWTHMIIEKIYNIS